MAPAPVVVVTGASRGLGRAVADRLAADGARVHVAHRDPARRAELRAVFDDRVHRVDFDEGDASAGLIAAVLGAEGRLDGVVHAVGDYRVASLEGTGLTDFRHLVESNLFSAVALLDASRAALRESRGACVLFGCAGLEALRARTTNPAYTAAKTALLSYARSLAREEAPHGVRVNVVSPGVIPHPHAAPDTNSPALGARVPLGRAGRPDEVAAAVAWLLSPEAGHVTGQNLEVAGGWLL